jgi:hypothetical protein
MRCCRHWADGHSVLVGYGLLKQDQRRKEFADLIGVLGRLRDELFNRGPFAAPMALQKSLGQITAARLCLRCAFHQIIPLGPSA